MPATLAPSTADLLLKQLKYIMCICDPIVHWLILVRVTLAKLEKPSKERKKKSVIFFTVRVGGQTKKISWF